MNMSVIFESYVLRDTNCTTKYQYDKVSFKSITNVREIEASV